MFLEQEAQAIRDIVPGQLLGNGKAKSVLLGVVQIERTLGTWSNLWPYLRPPRCS